MTVGKTERAADFRIWQAERMIWISCFLLKICAFLFASSAHLSSFLPTHCQQLHQKVSVMSPNHERTYIMVKVRLLPPLIARSSSVFLSFFRFFSFLVHELTEEDAGRRIVIE